jgi:hypothetical protein
MEKIHQKRGKKQYVKLQYYLLLRRGNTKNEISSQKSFISLFLRKRRLLLSKY